MRLMTWTTLLVIVMAGALVAGAIPVPLFTVDDASAHQCDFMTGGGWIVIYGAKGTFGVGGGCKFGSPTWGHLEYHDHGYSGTVTNGQGLNVHGTSITGYMEGGTVGSPKDPKRTGTRFICGTARTNLPFPNDNVNFVVTAKDAGEPGVNDQFDIYLKNQVTHAVVYDTLFECAFHYLGSSAPCSSPGDGGGGNIQLHKPNDSTTGEMGGYCDF